MEKPESDGANAHRGGGDESRDVERGGPGDAQPRGENPLEIQSVRPGDIPSSSSSSSCSGGGNVDAEPESRERTSPAQLGGPSAGGGAPEDEGCRASATERSEAEAPGREDGPGEGESGHTERESDLPLRSTEGASTTGCSPPLWPGLPPRPPSPAKSGGDAHVIDIPVRQSSKVEELDPFILYSITRTTSNFSVESAPGEQCRICQQHTEEPLMDLGCQCRGELARAHRTCVDRWFGNKGTNKCEVCLNVATNVPAPSSQPAPHFWVWRVGGGPYNGAAPRRATGARFHPLWAALLILIAGLLFDILISIFLGASALPVNIIIGVLVVLGLGTAARLVLECWHERMIRRNIRRMEEEHNFEESTEEQTNNNNNDVVANSQPEGQPPPTGVTTTPQPAAAVQGGAAEASHSEAVVETVACP